MKLLNLLSPALLAACALANDSSSSTSSSSSSSSSSALSSASSAVSSSASSSNSASSASSASEASSASSAPAAEPSSDSPEHKPLGETWSPKWTDSDLTPYTKHCESSATFKASIYTLGQMYPELKTYAPELKVFYHRQHYPGSWQGVDKHGNDRELIKMDTDAMPFGVKEWIKKTKQRRYSVQEDIVFFAPGAMYSILPLWVPESEEKGCDGVFDDLDNYSPELEDGKVVASLSYKTSGKHDLEFTIEAFQVKKKAEKVEEKDEL